MKTALLVCIALLVFAATAQASSPYVRQQAAVHQRALNDLARMTGLPYYLRPHWTCTVDSKQTTISCFADKAGFRILVYRVTR